FGKFTGGRFGRPVVVVNFVGSGTSHRDTHAIERTIVCVAAGIVVIGGVEGAVGRRVVVTTTIDGHNSLTGKTGGASAVAKVGNVIGAIDCGVGRATDIDGKNNRGRRGVHNLDCGKTGFADGRVKRQVQLSVQNRYRDDFGSQSVHRSRLRIDVVIGQNRDPFGLDVKHPLAALC